MTKAAFRFKQPVSRHCFAEMQSQAALALTAPYHVEELQAIEGLLSRHAIEHFVAVGCAQLRYMETALRHCRTYTAVEKYLEDHIGPEMQARLKKRCRINLLNKDFESISASDLPKGKKLFLFLFNVYSYIEDALETQKILAGPGDVIVVSSWNVQSPASWRLRNEYQHYMKKNASECSSPIKTHDYLDDAEKSFSSFCAQTKRVKGDVTDILTIHV